MSGRTWDIGDPEPEGVGSVLDFTDGYDDAHPSWGRTHDGWWKGYKDGGKTYVQWDELVRRYGPVTEDLR